MCSAASEGPRTATPFIAPHPKATLPSNFQDELAAKLREARLSRPEQNGEAEIGPCKGRGVLEPQPSSESWRSNITFHEEESRIPNKTFRENLGNFLCAGNNPQPQAALGGCLWVLLEEVADFRQPQSLLPEQKVLLLLNFIEACPRASRQTLIGTGPTTCPGLTAAMVEPGNDIVYCCCCCGMEESVRISRSEAPGSRARSCPS